ncbi:MAG TPA: type II secretion system protein N [Casimicrobiaceae bacterium]|nr:type II secretion system protein N [Casimicrobiaceae bacterium]
MAQLNADLAAAGPAAPLPLRWRVASWVATAGAILWLGYVIALWGWRWLGPAPARVAAPSLPERWTPAIVAAPLFGRGGAPQSAEVAAPATLQGDTRLLGVFAEAGGTGYALFRLSDRGPVLVRSGGEIASGVTLVEVRPSGVRIRDHGELRDIELRSASTAQGKAAVAQAALRGGVRAVCAPPAGYKGPIYRLNAELLTGVASSPESWQAVLVPVPGGLAIRDSSGFATMLGMKTGDRMTQANGIALAGVDDVQVAFVKPLIASQAVRVLGTRDGKPSEWLFLNAGACPG